MIADIVEALLVAAAGDVMKRHIDREHRVTMPVLTACADVRLTARYVSRAAERDQRSGNASDRGA